MLKSFVLYKYINIVISKLRVEVKYVQDILHKFQKGIKLKMTLQDQDFKNQLSNLKIKNITFLCAEKVLLKLINNKI